MAPAPPDLTGIAARLGPMGKSVGGDPVEDLLESGVVGWFGWDRDQLRPSVIDRMQTLREA